MKNDDVNVQFEFEDDTDDLLIWCEQPMKYMRLKRVDADCLYALLATRFGKQPLLLGDRVTSPDALQVGKAYLAYVEPNAPQTPSNKFTMFISHSVDTNVLINWLHENSPVDH